MGAGDPSSTILIDHGSYAVLPTIDRLQLGWLTWGLGGSDPLKYVGRVRVRFDPLKMSHSFIHNCCCRPYKCKFHNIKDEHLDTITSLMLLMLTMLMTDQLQADSVLQSMPLLLYWALSYRGQRQNSKTWVQVTRRQQSS